MRPVGSWIRSVTRGLGLRRGGSKIDDLIAPGARPEYDNVCALVTEHGWACVYVGVSEGDLDNFGYTVGLNGKGLPELLFCVEESDVATSMLNAIAKRLVEHGPNVHDGFEPFPTSEVRLRNIYPEEFFKKCVMAGLWAMEHGTVPGAGGMQVVLAGDDDTFPPD